MTYEELSIAQATRSQRFAEAQTELMCAYCDAEYDLKELQAKNAKLCELVQKMWPHVRHRSRMCAECELPCDKSHECLLYEPMRVSMRELGIEVVE